MGKLLKYEIRKNLGTVVVILIGLALLEGFFLISVATSKSTNSAAVGSIMSAVLLVLYSIVCFFMVFILSVRSYANELNTKTGFMLFMTPHTPTAIIVAKLLYTLIFGTLLAGLLVLCAVGDWAVLLGKYGQIEDFVEMFKSLFSMIRFNPGRFLVTLLGYVINFLLSFFSAVVLAYLAVTLSATFLQSNKYRGLISFLLFLAMIILIRVIGNLIPGVNPKVYEIENLLTAMIPSMILNLVVLIGGVFGSVWLLERKVSL